MSEFLSRIKARLETGHHPVPTFADESGWVRNVLEHMPDPWTSPEESGEAHSAYFSSNGMMDKSRGRLDGVPSLSSLSVRETNAAFQGSRAFWENGVYDGFLPNGFYSIPVNSMNKVRFSAFPTPSEARALKAGPCGDILVVDPGADVILRKLNDYVCTLVKKLEGNTHSMVRKIAEVVADFLGGPAFEVPQCRLEGAATGSAAVLIGQLKAGPCHPRAILFKYLADNVGLKSRMIMGSRWEAGGASHPNEQLAQDHISNLIAINGVECIVDVMQRPGKLRHYNVKSLVAYHILGTADTDFNDYDSPRSSDSPMELTNPFYLGLESPEHEINSPRNQRLKRGVPTPPATPGVHLPPQSASSGRPPAPYEYTTSPSPGETDGLYRRNSGRKAKLGDDRSTISSPEPQNFRFIRRVRSEDGSVPSSPEHMQGTTPRRYQRHRAAPGDVDSFGSIPSSPEPGGGIGTSPLVSSSRAMEDPDAMFGSRSNGWDDGGSSEATRATADGPASKTTRWDRRRLTAPSGMPSPDRPFHRSTSHDGSSKVVRGKETRISPIPDEIASRIRAMNEQYRKERGGGSIPASSSSNGQRVPVFNPFRMNPPAPQQQQAALGGAQLLPPPSPLLQQQQQQQQQQQSPCMWCRRLSAESVLAVNSSEETYLRRFDRLGIDYSRPGGSMRRASMADADDGIRRAASLRLFLQTASDQEMTPSFSFTPSASMLLLDGGGGGGGGATGNAHLNHLSSSSSAGGAAAILPLNGGGSINAISMGLGMGMNTGFPPLPANAVGLLPFPEWHIEFSEVRIGTRVGIGSFGEVFRGTWRGTEVAVKLLLEQHLTKENTEDFCNEISLLSRLRHPNVILFLGACTKPPHLSMVTEFMSMGSLYRLIHTSGLGAKLSWKRRLRMLRDICRGMMCVQRMRIVHRDLKSANCLVDKHWNVKVCDFGLSRIITSDGSGGGGGGSGGGGGGGGGGNNGNSSSSTSPNVGGGGQ